MTAIILSIILAGLGLRMACYGWLGMGAHGIAEWLTETKLEDKPWAEFRQVVLGVALVLAALAVARWG